MEARDGPTKPQADVARFGDQKTIANGWTRTLADLYRFEHMPTGDCENLLDGRERCWVVESVNGSYTDENATHMHYNRYFAFDLSAAVATAATIEISAQQVAEWVVNIRPATDEEIKQVAEVEGQIDLYAKTALPAD